MISSASGAARSMPFGTSGVSKKASTARKSSYTKKPTAGGSFSKIPSFLDKYKNSGGGAGGFSAALLAKGTSQANGVSFWHILTERTGREAAFLRDRADILRMRILAIKSKQCASKKNKYYCPEIFLDAVADKLTTTADLFLDAELLSKFYYQVRPPYLLVVHSC